ncbi:MAG: putative manganese transporter, partial [Bacteroidales bacterium]
MLIPAWEILRESLVDTLPVIPILLPVYVALEYFSHHGGRDLVARLRIGRRNGPLAGTLLGLIPQCGMSVLVTSFYLLQRVTTGTLLATYVATSDEAIPVLLADRHNLSLVGGLVLIKAVAGMGWGYVVDVFLPSRTHVPPGDPGALAPERAIHMAHVDWKNLIV